MMEKEIFLRKIKIRKQAYESLGNKDFYEDEFNHINKNIEQINCEILESINIAEQNKFSNYQILVKDKNKVKWFIKCSLRKIFFLLYGWLLYPIIESQNLYKNEILNTLRSYRQYNMELENVIREQAKEIEELKGTIKSQKQGE